MLKMMRGVALAVLVAACGQSLEPEVDLDGALITAPLDVTLTYGQEVQVEGTLLRMILAAVPEDSRCPVDVTCVWEGNALVEVGIGVGMGPTFPIQMNTSLQPQSVTWNDIEVTLLELTPLPTSTTPIRVEDYAVKLRLQPLS